MYSGGALWYAIALQKIIRQRSCAEISSGIISKD